MSYIKSSTSDLLDITNNKINNYPEFIKDSESFSSETLNIIISNKIPENFTKENIASHLSLIEKYNLEYHFDKCCCEILSKFLDLDLSNTLDLEYEVMYLDFCLTTLFRDLNFERFLDLPVDKLTKFESLISCGLLKKFDNDYNEETIKKYLKDKNVLCDLISQDLLDECGGWLQVGIYLYISLILMINES